MKYSYHPYAVAFPFAAPARLALGLMLSIGAATGCAGNSLIQPTSSPVLYPNDYYRSVGVDRARTDTRDCMSVADQYVKEPEKWQGALKETGKGAVVGAAAGAVGGTIFGKAGRGTAAGAAVGGITGLASELWSMGERSPSYQRFTEHCLQKKGYEVVGWE